MSNPDLEGRGATVNMPEAKTHNKPCVVGKWYEEYQKYQVDFDTPWSGFYTLEQLTLDEEIPE